eukprot:CAMPEP_0178900048 /NCGR_PEP_ID=MMETSP0786-20121207/3251_1 /TAXON_ID=186022 /ORGANISM="Thalassionema frauenfeldii, Strain CCMP 1798" /LENGTH=289 /DNA_ID=CAMNT_0020570997 /DNA_START=102 /DNA_END=971 /DNA_ORIENTATION=+
MNVSKWRKRMHEDENYGTKVWVDSPLDTDVLLGKQRDAFNHIGNRSFRSLINANWERYNNAKGRCERTAIVVSIVKFLRDEREVRFLKKDPATKRWFIVPNSVAREKVGHAIRDAINFRRHHDRKNAQSSAPEHSTLGYNTYLMEKDRRKHLLPQHNPDITLASTSLHGTFQSDYSEPSSMPQNQGRNTSCPEASYRSSRLDSLQNIISKQETEDAAELLGSLKQSRTSSERISQRAVVISPTTKSQSTKDTKINHQNTIPNIPSNTTDEAAMMGAFNIWASFGKHLKA